MSDVDVECIFADLSAALSGPAASVLRQRCIAMLPASEGGLQPVAAGLFHPAASVRHNAALILHSFESDECANFAMRTVNPFLRIAYDSLKAQLGIDQRNAAT